jgi:hypothetical protein
LETYGPGYHPDGASKVCREGGEEGPEMSKTTVNTQVIEDAVRLACRAPSYHNSQPWRWILDGDRLELFLDPHRIVVTDNSGRQALISCGAVLDHFRVAIAAGGYQADIDRYPKPPWATSPRGIGAGPTRS